MLLAGKTAIVYGAGGAIGRAVSLAYAREGARVFVTGRSKTRLEQVATEAVDAGGVAEVAELDATDQAAVTAHAAQVADAAGGIDIAFNATANDDVQGVPLTAMSYTEFIQPVVKAVTTQFVIATAVAPHMAGGRGGAILVMGGGREAIPLLGGAHVAWSALAGLCRQLASELGLQGIRVAWLLSPGSPDAGVQDESHAENTLIKRLPSLEDVANAAVFFGSDWARTMTATELNLTGGAVVD